MAVGAVPPQPTEKRDEHTDTAHAQPATEHRSTVHVGLGSDSSTSGSIDPSGAGRTNDQGQSVAVDVQPVGYRWSVEFGLGFDNSMRSSAF